MRRPSSWGVAARIEATASRYGAVLDRRWGFVAVAFAFWVTMVGTTPPDAEAAGLRTAGLVFAAMVIALALLVLALLVRDERD
jgi:hypothetical protein